LVNIAANFTQN